MAGNHLQEARVSKDLTQEELAKLARVSPSTVIRAEKGARISPLSEARLARALTTPREVLFPQDAPEEVPA